MKRMLLIVLCLMGCFSMLVSAGCGGAETESTAVDVDAPVDLDITEMSPVMVYSNVFDMVTYPEKYDGKIIKMKGTAISYSEDGSGETYHACIVQDATACCAQGLEYILADSVDYPKDEEEITVLGVFEECVEGEDFAYGRIVDAKLL